MNVAFYNGIFTEFESLRIPLCDRSVFFGDGVYDVVVGCNNRLYLIDEHLERFYGNIERIGLKPYMAKNTLLDIIKRLIDRSGLSEYQLYMQASGTSPIRAHSRNSNESNLLLCVFKNTTSSEFLPLRLRSIKDCRGTLCDVKTINLLPAVLSSTENTRLGFDESVYIRDGNVTECAHSSLAIVKNRVFYLPPLTNAVLPGITRARSVKLLSEIGIKCVEAEIKKDSLYSADEVLILSTTKFCKWASEIDGIRFVRKKAVIGEILSKRLLEDYRKS